MIAKKNKDEIDDFPFLGIACFLFIHTKIQYSTNANNIDELVPNIHISMKLTPLSSGASCVAPLYILLS